MYQLKKDILTFRGSGYMPLYIWTYNLVYWVSVIELIYYRFIQILTFKLFLHPLPITKAQKVKW